MYYSEALSRIDDKLRFAVHYKIDGTLDQIVWDDVAYKAVHGVDQVHPSMVDIEAMRTIVKAEKDALAYQGKRREEYPSIEEQLDIIFWDKKNGTTEWEDSIQVIKNKYPK
ncbi:uncharacterized protein METZ01_LOCUS222094 [marine metagenome]|uniref:Uncharacterized protein n=1 Tax=marine metagenome TaxID=408172 RepID=A0A382G1Y1_9ZZZZ